MAMDSATKVKTAPPTAMAMTTPGLSSRAARRRAKGLVDIFSPLLRSDNLGSVVV